MDEPNSKYVAYFIPINIICVFDIMEHFLKNTCESNFCAFELKEILQVFRVPITQDKSKSLMHIRADLILILGYLSKFPFL